MSRIATPLLAALLLAPTALAQERESVGDVYLVAGDAPTESGMSAWLVGGLVVAVALVAMVLAVRLVVARSASSAEAPVSD